MLLLQLLRAAPYLLGLAITVPLAAIRYRRLERIGRRYWQSIPLAPEPVGEGAYRVAKVAVGTLARAPVRVRLQAAACLLVGSLWPGVVLDALGPYGHVRYLADSLLLLVMVVASTKGAALLTGVPLARVFATGGRRPNALVISAALYGFASFLSRPHLTVCRADPSSASATAIRAMAEAWRSEHARNECPTLDRLVDDRMIAPGARLTDSWGGRFRILCADDETVVWSSGRDGVDGTADDVQVPRDVSRLGRR